MPLQHTSGDLLADRRYAYAEACLADGDAAGAGEMAEQVLERAPRFAPAWFLLGRAREMRHRTTGAAEERAAALRAYAAALDLDPDDELGTRARLARLGARDGLGALSPAYVRALFDGYAPRFERHLVEGLRYRGPALLREALDALPGAPAHFPDLLDLGCGTGLVGEAFASRADRLTGVDLSPAMLAIARRSGRYHRLVEGDLSAFLAGEPDASADLVVAADVLIYVGLLDGVLGAMARVLRPGGLAALTLDAHDGPGVILGPEARYAHADAYLRAAAASAGLALALRIPAAIRHERGRGVPGRVAVLRRPA